MYWKSIEDIDIAQGIKADHTQAIKEEWMRKKKKCEKEKIRKRKKEKFNA